MWHSGIIILLLLSMCEFYKSEEAACVKEHEDEAINCLNNSHIRNESERLQNTLFVDFHKEKHDFFCEQWAGEVRGCLEDAIHGCSDLEKGFHGTIEAYNYICGEEGKKKYEKIAWCSTDSYFKMNSNLCVKGFNSAVEKLDPRYGSIERYKIITSPKPIVTDKWEESCSRTFEFIHCQESVISYCGPAMRHYFTGDKDEQDKKEQDLSEDAKSFQHHFMSHMFAEHQSVLDCARLTTLALILIIFACATVFIALICLIPFCCCRAKRTGMVATPSHPYGIENLAFRSEKKDKTMKGP